MAIKSARPMKPFRCKNGHILGYVRWNDEDLPQLMVLRESLDMEAERPDEVDYLGPLDGNMPIRCKCDEVMVWRISVDSMLALFVQLDDAQVFEFSRRLLEMSRKVGVNGMNRGIKTIGPIRFDPDEKGGAL